MENKKIVWGACWFNESTDTVIKFFKNTIQALTEKGYEIYPVIFDARFEHNIKDNNRISSLLKNVLIIENKFNCFPNKNYGIAAISKYAQKVKSKYIAIVDPDWNVEEYSSFMDVILKPVIENKYDIVIPDIGKEAGRDNLLIGKVALSLFYPDYFNIIKTAFPGSLIGLTDKINKITLSEEYHYDWGGEWDIISYAIKNNFRIGSVPIKVENVRHRSNSSKIMDAYQIWRAILSNEDIIVRYSNIKLYNKKINAIDDFSYELLNNSYSAKDQIQYIVKNAENETQKQLLYMILYPLASILEEINYLPDINEFDKEPYERNKIEYMSDLAIHCFKIALLNSNFNIEDINKSAKKMTNVLCGDWNKEMQKKALREACKSFSKED